jgi:hypothetical protein
VGTTIDRRAPKAGARAELVIAAGGVASMGLRELEE